MADCGIQNENGMHDAGECITTFASGGRRTLTVDTEGTVSNDGVPGTLSSTPTPGR